MRWKDAGGASNSRAEPESKIEEGESKIEEGESSARKVTQMARRATASVATTARKSVARLGVLNLTSQSDVSLVVSFTGDNVIDAEVPPAVIVELVDDKL